MKVSRVAAYFALITLTVCAMGEETAPPANDRINRMLSKLKLKLREDALKNLAESQTIVICDFNSIQGRVIKEVIRGDAKVGELWNASLLPAKPILVYEKFVIGDLEHVGGAVSSSGFYLLDGQGKVLISVDYGITLTIKEIQTHIQRSPKAEAECPANRLQTTPDSNPR
jgi:hypothetical protein